MLPGEDSQRLYEKILHPFGYWQVEALREPVFDFASHANYSSRDKEHFQRLSQLSQSKLNRLADEFIFFDRTLYGLCRIFERLGARVCMRRHWIDAYPIPPLEREGVSPTSRLISFLAVFAG